MSDVIRLDDMRSFYINEKDIVIIIVFDNSIENYTYEHLLNFYLNHTGATRLDIKTKYIIHDELKLLFIPLYNKDKIFLEYTYSELDNFDILSKHTFVLMKNSGGKKYVLSTFRTGQESMHQIIFGRKARKGYKIDHVDSNGLDNRRKKLREITNSGNASNRIKKKETTSKYIGVTKTGPKWTALISFNRCKYYLGRYHNEKDAAKIRDAYAVHYYKNEATLNRDDDGNFLLSEEDINNILVNGIPEKYSFKKKEKKGNLPKNIYQLPDGRFFYRLEHNRKYYRGYYQTLNKTIEALKQQRSLLEEIKEMERLKLETNITRNEYGIAVLKTYNRGIVREFWVDDEIWKLFIHYGWNSDKEGNYASGIIDNYLDTLHRHVYKYFFGSVPDNKTVDHINSNCKMDCRIQNLRAADGSEQCQNRDLPRESSIKYTGVIVSHGRFITRIQRGNNKRTAGPFETMEEAALKYNDLAKEMYGEYAKLNIVPNTRTTIEKYFHKNNLTVDMIKSIKTAAEIKSIFMVNLDWRKINSIQVDKIYRRDLQKYKDMIIELVKNKTEDKNYIKMLYEKYTGIQIMNGKFFAEREKKGVKKIRKGPFEYLEDAAKISNLIAAELGVNGKINVIPDTKTTIEDCFNKDNLTVGIIQRFDKVFQIQCLFVANPSWNANNSIKIRDIKKRTLLEYKNIVLIMLKQELLNFYIDERVINNILIEPQEINSE